MGASGLLDQKIGLGDDHLSRLGSKKAPED
jgi:hypothetical protein